MKAVSRTETARALETAGVVAILRMTDTSQIDVVVDALVAGGICAFEVTMTTPDAIAVLAQLSDRLRDTPCVVGMGTVMDVATVEPIVRAGARFVVGPTFMPAIIHECHRLDVAAVPGCFTPTEVVFAVKAGADLVKLFPAAALGPAFLRYLLEPLPHLRLMATGGVELDDAARYIEAGAAVVGLGLPLLGATGSSQEVFTTLSERAMRLVEAVRAARASCAPGTPAAMEPAMGQAHATA